MILPVTLNRETRLIEVEKGLYGRVFALGKPAIFRFKTGTKNHAPSRPQIIEKNGKYCFTYEVIHNKHVYPVAWNDNYENSLWTGVSK